MKTGFKDATEVKEKKRIKSPWNFDCPSYDERTSCYVNAGSHYGIGHKTPVGSKEPKNGYSIPMGRINTLSVDESPRRNLSIEMRD